MFHINFAINRDDDLKELLTDSIPPCRIDSDKPSLCTVRRLLVDAFEEKSVDEACISHCFIGKRTLYQSLFRKVDIPSNKTTSIERCTEKVTGLIIADIKERVGSAHSITYEHLVEAVMTNPIHNLVPYLR